MQCRESCKVQTTEINTHKNRIYKETSEIINTNNNNKRETKIKNAFYEMRVTGCEVLRNWWN